MKENADDNVEKKACIDIYNAWNGPNWTSSQFSYDSNALSSGWNTEEPLSKWHGIVIDLKSGLINQIDLSNNNVSGSFTPTVISGLKKLNSLENLWLSMNPKLCGSLPDELLDIPKLRILGVFRYSLSLS